MQANVTSALHGLNPRGPNTRQRGFSVLRIATILAVLVGILLIPLWRNKQAKEDALASGDTANVASGQRLAGKVRPSSSTPNPTLTAEPNPGQNSASNTNPNTPSAPLANNAGAAAATTINPDRPGLSFGHMRLTNTNNPGAILYSACAGEPKDMTAALDGQCNTRSGDMSCRTALPVLCVLKDGSTAQSAGLLTDPQIPAVEGGHPGYSTSAGWAGGALGATAPVTGFVLGSLAQAHARCEKELGTGWAMAEVNDGQGARGVVGKRGPGLTNTNTRHWVYVNDQKANCWDPA
jgi:hypothetical protein